jgi:hypothetical protein
MFGLIKTDPQKKLDKRYRELLKQAMEAQRSGDIHSYSELSEQADKVYQELKKLTRDSEVS